MAREGTGKGRENEWEMRGERAEGKRWERGKGTKGEEGRRVKRKREVHTVPQRLQFYPDHCKWGTEGHPTKIFFWLRQPSPMSAVAAC